MLILIPCCASQTEGGEKMESNLEKVGALWQNTSAEGKSYFNLDLEGQKFVVFPNGFKSEEKQPDFLVYERVKETQASQKSKK